MTKIDIASLRAMAKLVREERKRRKTAKVPHRKRNTRIEVEQFRSCREGFLKDIKWRLEAAAARGGVAASTVCRNDYGPGIRALYSVKDLLDKRGFKTRIEEYTSKQCDEVPAEKFTRLHVRFPMK